MRSTWPLSLEVVGRQDEQPQATLLADLFELGSGEGRCPAAGFHHVPAGDDIAGLKLLKHHPEPGAQVERVHLDQVSRLLDQGLD